MHPPSRRVLAAAMALTLVLAALVVRSSGPDGGAEERLAAQDTTTTAPPVPVPDTAAESAPATTVRLVPITTGVPVPGAVEAPPPTAAPTATPGAPRSMQRLDAPAPAGAAVPGATATAVTADGAVLSRPVDTAATRPVDKAKGCDSAGDRGWRIERCGALRSSGTVLLWVVERKGDAVRALVLREQTEGRWSVVLAASDDAGTRFSRIGVRGEDVSGDGQPELLFGFHRRDAERTLALDVVDVVPAGVVVHRELPRGSVQAPGGTLQTWAAAGDGFDRTVIRFTASGWQAAPPQRATRDDVPASIV